MMLQSKTLYRKTDSRSVEVTQIPLDTTCVFLWPILVLVCKTRQCDDVSRSYVEYVSKT